MKEYYWMYFVLIFLLRNTVQGTVELIDTTLVDDISSENEEPKSEDVSDIEFPWLSSIIEQMNLQRNNKVMKLPILSQQLTITNNGNSQSQINGGFRPANPPERIVSGSQNNGNNQPSPTNNGEVTETDMYLLGAIEKLAYRVETMEKRLRRTEELLHHLMQTTGNDVQRQDPCPINFTRVERGCYHFSNRQYNWKSASSMCKSLGSNLLELETPDEYNALVTYLSSIPSLRDNEFWTGGLNPGLLWIWSNSARPVLPKKPNPSRPVDVIHGNGRCLRLSFHNVGKVYQYHGSDCGLRYKYICEHEENITIRALKNYQKSLRDNTTISFP